MSVGRLALLVGAHLGECLLVRDRVVLDRNLRRHAAHCKGTAPMTGLDDELRIGPQEVTCHRHLLSIRQDEIRTLLNFFMKLKM